MCGIFAYFSSFNLDENIKKELEIYSNKIKHRGPDMSRNKLVLNNTSMLVFHRLSIVDTSDNGMQPFYNNNSHSICNGEIYNYKLLETMYDMKLASTSDCEVISPLVDKVGIKKACELLDGVFAFVLVDKNENITVARDPFGVRSLYIGTNNKGDLCISSELKGIPPGFKIKPFSPGTYSIYKKDNNKYIEVKNERYYEYKYTISPKIETRNQITHNIRSLLEKAVSKRLIGDRPIGCLLSGGLDSSIIASLLCKYYQTDQRKLKTFSVGLKDSVDLHYAKIVADYLGTDHTEVVLSEQDMLDGIKENIYHIESYDITTVRASTPMMLLCKYIKKNTDVTVIFSGEGSDEASGSYMYFHNSPDTQSFHKETERLLSELHFFDVLRADKSSAAAGLEIRVPFLDKKFIKYYMSIDPSLKIPGNKIEKLLLRESFEDILPNEVTWRIKEGMSDGVSSNKKSWFSIIKEYCSTKVNKEDYKKYEESDSPTPPSDEALYFRNIFEQNYKGLSHVTPHYWLPKWSGDTKEPSARTLNVYKEYIS
jgi:asparagine synthase (glutamine-hydrolysing)